MGDAPEIIAVASFVVGITVRLPRMPFPGETLVADQYDLGPGGKGTNMAIAAARQGCNVAAVVRVGNDDFGEMASRIYRREGINTQYMIRDAKEPTAVGLVYLQSSGENTIGLYRGANWVLVPQDLDVMQPLLKNARVMLVQLEIPDETVLRAVRMGYENNLTVILNPAPARFLSDEILKFVDILTPNEGEARSLIGISPEDQSMSIEQVGRQLLNRGVKTLIITLGSKGCLLMRPGTESLHIPAFTVQPVDTVGAGDAFNGGLAVAFVDGKSIEDAVRWANITAALSTQKIGAVDGLPTRDEVQKRI